ncbi:MAG: protein BatD [Oscillospiraceae bacterium]|nr:protein BatD [Oscillospiraceae bacterium]
MVQLFFPLEIGVIGGADGPTAVFIAVRPSVWIWLGAGLLLGAVCLLAYRKKKKRR